MIKQRFYAILMHVSFIFQQFSEMSYTLGVACSYLYTTSIMHMNDVKFCANNHFSVCIKYRVGTKCSDYMQNIL